MKKLKIAVLDDYQQVALSMADWSAIQAVAEVTIFKDHQAEEAGVIKTLLPFEIVCVMRERTPLTKNILVALPNLKLIVSTGSRNASIDVEAATALNIEVKNTGYLETGMPELTWALLLALAKNIIPENKALKQNGWQTALSTDIAGKTIGLVGLGRTGSKVASFAKAFNMKVIAWSENLTTEKATTAGATMVTKEQLFNEADFVSVHLVLSARSKNIIGAAEFNLMKKTAYFINASRGAIVNEEALLEALTQQKIAGAALDVYDIEPLPANHPFRNLNNVLATPHIGYVTENTYRLFYGDTVQIITEWLQQNRAL